MDVMIYQPSRAATQSGTWRTSKWVLESRAHLSLRGVKIRDPLMGWTGSRDTSAQVRLHFVSREAAVSYAKRRGLRFLVEESRSHRPVIKSYADKFRFDRIR